LFASDKKLGSVSPRSNNATICTIPISAINQKGVGRSLSRRLFEKYHKKYSRFEETPTAHGFCMLIRRKAIRKIGLFDEVFGRGYGEEVDFSQRLKKSGWLTGIANWAFAYHLEARSFSMKTKQELLAVNGKIIMERYPDYRLSVRKKIEMLKHEEALILSGLDKLAIKVSIVTIQTRKKIHSTFSER
jgi:GT2 family glycosyltransferase